VHLIRVAMTLVRWGRVDSTLLQAALLHDTVEDTETSLDELAAGYGSEVAELVAWLTCPDAGVHHAAYYERLAEHGPEAARTLKVADRIDNLRSQEALLARTGSRHAQWVHTYIGRTEWQVLPLTRTSASPARAELVIAMADLSALVALSRETPAG
jgi:(p)ppGpp synthase/HD superfamily hydrolase